MSNHDARHASKAKHKQNHVNDMNESPKTANFPLYSVTTLFLKHAAASDGLNMLSKGVGTMNELRTRDAYHLGGNDHRCGSGSDVYFFQTILDVTIRTFADTFLN